MADRAIFFDLFDTLLIPRDLVRHRDEAGIALSRSLSDSGIELSPEIAGKVLDTPKPATKQGDLTVFERRIHTFLMSQGIRPPTGAVQAGATAILKDTDLRWTLDPSAIEVIANFKEKKYATGLVTNFDHYPYVRGLISRLSLLEMFDTVMISSEVGFDKPDPEIFRKALGSLGAEASVSVHVGDDDVDVAGALAAGIRPIRIVRDQRLADSIARTGEEVVTSLRALADVV